jgi:hypothetical protein
MGVACGQQSTGQARAEELYRMRLVLDITSTPDGRYEGYLTVPGTASRQDFAGILELLAILEQQLQPGEHEDPGSAERESGTDLGPS